MIANVLTQLGLISVGVWTVTEILHKRLWRIPTDLLALLVGMGLSVSLEFAGYLDSPASEEWWQRLLGAAVMGLIATAMSNKLHDWLAKPAKEKGIEVLESLRQ